MFMNWLWFTGSWTSNTHTLCLNDSDAGLLNSPVWSQILEMDPWTVLCRVAWSKLVTSNQLFKSVAQESKRRFDRGLIWKTLWLHRPSSLAVCSHNPDVRSSWACQDTDGALVIEKETEIRCLDVLPHPCCWIWNNLAVGLLLRSPV